MKMIMVAEYPPKSFFFSFDAQARLHIAMTAEDFGNAGLDAPDQKWG